MGTQVGIVAFGVGCGEQEVPGVYMSLSMSPMAGMRQLSVSRPVKTIYNVQTEAEYRERVVRSIKPTLVMWHTPGCQDCEKLSGKFETAVDLVDGLDLVEVDATNLKELAMSRRIMDPLPATIAMIQGQELGLAMTGVLDDKKVKTLVNFMLSLDPKDWNFSVNYSIVEYDLAL